MRILSPPTAEEPTHGSDHVGKDSSPVSLFCRSLHQECFTTLFQSKGSTLFLKIAGCVPTIPKMEHGGQRIAPKTVPATAAPSDSPTLRLFDHFFLRPLPFTSQCILFVPPGVVFQSAWECGRSARDLQSRVTGHKSRVTSSRANDNSANHREPPQPGFLARTLLSTDHKAIGLNYLWLALFSVFLGLAMSLLMRIHLVWPGLRLPFLHGAGFSLERYAALTTFHGSLMVFLVLTAAPQAGFGNYFLPLQIGAREMAFPTLNLFAFWATVASLLGLTSTFFIPPRPAITLWIVSVAIFCVASLLNALNFSVTTIDLRAPGMTLPRLPLTVWAWFINAILGALIFSILLAACVCLLSDRLLGTHFFPALNLVAAQPAGGIVNAIPVLWKRLFWFFAQAEVYVAMLPCFGLTTHLISTFSRKPVWKERLVVLALCGVGLFGFYVWGQHMFSSGMNPFSPLVFSLLASSLGLPAAILLLSWLGTLWNARVQLNTAMLFALGFISLFLSGGLSGIFLARHGLAAAAVSDDFVTGHFHLVMGVAATFAILGALFFWFPTLYGRRLNETLGKIFFWMTFAGAFCVFMPMHWLGLIAHSR